MQHTEPTVSDRGFAAMPEIRGVYPGDRILAYESSTSDEPVITVRSKEPGREAARIALTAENAWRLSDQLRTLVRNHYQRDATPEWARAALIEQLAADHTLCGISGDAGCTETDLAEAVADVILGRK